jgi:hypothetical protein
MSLYLGRETYPRPTKNMTEAWHFFCHDSLNLAINNMGKITSHRSKIKAMVAQAQTTSFVDKQ